jgi:hypothetical protein
MMRMRSGSSRPLAGETGTRNADDRTGSVIAENKWEETMQRIESYRYTIPHLRH